MWFLFTFKMGFPPPATQIIERAAEEALALFKIGVLLQEEEN